MGVHMRSHVLEGHSIDAEASADRSQYDAVSWHRNPPTSFEAARTSTLPLWATDSEFNLEDEAVFYTGVYGDIDLGASLLFGELSDLTSVTPRLYISVDGFRNDIGDATPERLRRLASALRSAAHRLEKDMHHAERAVDPIDQVVIAEVAALIADHGWSPVDAAAKLGWSPSKYRSRMDGRTSWTIVDAAAVACAIYPEDMEEQRALKRRILDLALQESSELSASWIDDRL